MRQRDRPRGRDRLWRDRREREKSENMIERESVYKNGWGERYNKIIKKIDYLNKRGDRIDELMWVFYKNDSVK